MENTPQKVLKRMRPYREAFYYQKSEVLYQMTYVFCQRFLPAHGDRTVDQMVQAARSGKQNIVEGTEDGEASTEMHIKLLNVARASLQELREDYRDYLLSRHLNLPYMDNWNDEEMANIALTLCYQTDSMLNKELQHLEKEFIEQGGIKERMHAARTGYRQAQDAELAQLRQENPQLKSEIELLKAEIERLKGLLQQHGIAVGD